MKNYKTIRAGEIQPGDILKCSVSVDKGHRAKARYKSK